MQSLPIRAREDEAPFALPIVQLKRSARDLRGTDGVMVMIADGASRMLPSAGILRCLYDLTPAEAWLARSIGEGTTPSDIARSRGKTFETVRSQVRAVFGKVGVRRQSNLVRLLAGIASPHLVASEAHGT